ncbi:MAG: MazG nucleotide pyrophosphohydrolase domain-containing protein [Armatimonadota bacterium]
MTVSQFQRAIRETYFARDSARGRDATFAWLVEEVGELSRALRAGDEERMAEEFGDVLAWVATLASIVGVDLERAVRRYEDGCPKCGKRPCECRESSWGG